MRSIVTTMEIREHTTWELMSPLPPDRVIAVLVDFGDERMRIWAETSHPAVYRVHAVGDTWAEVTEGVPFSWSRERYDWSTPGVITLDQLESNVAIPALGRIVYTVTAGPSAAGTHIRCDRRRTFRSNPRGLIAAAIMRTVGPRLLRRQFGTSLSRLSVRPDRELDEARPS
jgi:hypothetical protein